ncbi:MAG TPA: tRNA lysidine(34) synthetase TilS [Tepidisphaeraceae bacterium]|nr:tRNA lysidine(34) synthetase TilS [Tepidisphaeraceae bacterium]
MIDPLLADAIAAVPAGRWAVAVSGGADSVALLSLLRARTDLSLHIAHLDHQTRGSESAADAKFVVDLASQSGLACTVARRDEIEPLLVDPPRNPSARYRAARLEFFRKVVRSNDLMGAILAHHADDQAETVLHRLLRNSSYTSLAGMLPRITIDKLLILRPLLGVRRQALRDYLLKNNLRWREDASNQSPKYFRNRMRKLLAAYPSLFDELIDLSAACARLRQWARSTAPPLQERISINDFANLPKILANESSRKWLIDRGVPAREIKIGVIDRLIAMADDAATPARQDFPGGVRVRRRGRIIFSDKI